MPGANTNTLSELSRFLAGQIVPNSVVPTPAAGRAGLVLSYKMTPDADGYRYTFSRAHLYDNALASIAFLLLDKPVEAGRILDAMVEGAFGRKDLWFSVNTHNEWPTPTDTDWATTRTGATAWAGYAAVLYLVDELIRDKTSLTSRHRLQRLLGFATELGEAILTRQVLLESDPRNGLITGGNGVTSLVIKGGQVEEVFQRSEVDWVSYENNIDAYFFLRDLAALSPAFRSRYASRVELLGRAIRNGFDPAIGQIRRGANAKAADPLEALDCASWGSICLRALGADREAETALRATAGYEGTDGGVRGFKPYRNQPVYEFPEAQRWFYPDKPDMNWSEFPMVWSEGSFGVALAFARAGDRVKADRIAGDLLESRMNLGGGVRYASRTLRFQFGESPSVSGSAWGVLVLKNLEGDARAKRFWSAVPPLQR